MNMDPKQFHQRLSQLAEIELVSVPRDAARREADEPALVKYRGEMIELNLKNNPTLNLRVKQIHHEPRSCEDCGDTVTDRRTERKLCTFPERHWRETCLACKMTRHPETGEFCLSSSQAVNVYRTYLNTPDLRVLMKRPTK